MTTKSTKRALLMSCLALFMCFTMLLGTTFAWFTDSVTSAGNKIIAGNFDVELYLWTDATTPVAITNNPNPIFGEGAIAQNDASATLWEPGKTQVVYLSIKNNGSLDLKYKVSIDVRNETNPPLSDVMRYAITPDAQYDSVTSWNGGLSVVEGANITTDGNVFLEAGAEHFFALSVHMEESATNEYMNGKISFDINVIAGQVASEEDGFGSDYDALSPYPDGSYRVDSSETVAEGTAGELLTAKDDKGTFVVNATAGSEGKITSVISSASSTESAFAFADANGLNLASYDIEVTGQSDGSDVEVSLYLGKSFMGVTVYHDGVAMDSADYSYDPNTGYVTFTTADFSVFDITYSKTPATVSNSYEDLTNAKGQDGSHVLGTDITAENIIHFGSGTNNVLDLNGKTITAGNLGQYILGAQQGATLVLTGNGTVNAGKGFMANKGDAKIVVNGGTYNTTATTTLNSIKHSHLAQNNSTIIVNGGTFTTNVDNAVLFFATSNARIEINGGFFENTADKTPDLLGIGTNKGNTNRIVITGGTFVNYNPLEDKMTYTGEWPEAGEAAFGGPWILIPGGYTVVSETQENGDIWYSVVPVTPAQ